MGEAFSERFFHDTLLKAGNMLLYYLKDFLKRKLEGTNTLIFLKVFTFLFLSFYQPLNMGK